MTPAAPSGPGGLMSGHAFTTTHWSVVMAAAQDGSSQADAALEELCRAYWPPLYAFIRRRGWDEHQAKDLTQEFFARLLRKSYLRGVDRTKGKFRSFLLAALEHFLANEWRAAHAQKRGGKAAFISLDDEKLAENHYLQLASPGLSPEKLFERQWALTLLEGVLGRLRAEFTAGGKEELFDALKVFLTGEKSPITYAELAAKLGKSEAAIKMAVSRDLRKRYGELLRAEITKTVSRPEEVEDELSALLAAVS